MPSQAASSVPFWHPTPCSLPLSSSNRWSCTNGLMFFPIGAGNRNRWTVVFNAESLERLWVVKAFVGLVQQQVFRIEMFEEPEFLNPLFETCPVFAEAVVKEEGQLGC